MSKLCSPLALLLSSLTPPTPVPASRDGPYIHMLLFWAAKKGHPAVVKHILQHHNVSVDVGNRVRQSPLFLAAAHGHEMVCQILLDNGAKPDLVDYFKCQTPLSAAVENSREATARLLVEHHADIEAKDIIGQTPLSKAAEVGNESIVALLLEKEANVDAIDNYRGQKPLSWASAGGFFAVVKTLLDAGADLEARDRSRMTALSWAARNGHNDVVQFLVGAGADVLSYDTSLRTALAFAAGHGHEIIVDFLIKAGSEVQPSEPSLLGDYRPLPWAKREGHTKIVELLENNQPRITHAEETTAPPGSCDNSDSLDLQTQHSHTHHVETTTSNHLCKGCSNLDFAKYFTESVDKQQPNSTPRAHRDAVQLGVVSDLIQRSTYCPFCQLVVEALCLRWSKSRNVRPDDIAGERNVLVSIYSYTSANYGSAGFKRVPSPSAAYSIGLQTTRPQDGDRPCPSLLEGQIALIGEDAQKLGQHGFGQARVVPDGQVNSELLKSWLKECEHHHRWCQLQAPRRDIDGFLLIDTCLMCVVDAPPQCRYVALSYSWGTAAVMTLVKDNEHQLKKQDGLKGVWDRVPRTIQDAVDLCRELGERYLWVDSFCIVQDDHLRKDTQILQMGCIYQQAELTLVAAYGTHANAGIPGVRPGSRPSKQVTRKVGDMTMAVRFNYVEDVVDTSSWNTRAWTYQERCLSRRLLFMTSTQSYFICAEKIFCEDTITECDTRSFFLDTIYWRPMRIPRGLYTAAAPTSVHLLTLTYRYHLQTFTQREMTWQSDALNAFSAILDMTASQLDTRMWQGLPEQIFDIALLWTPSSITKRREVPKDCTDTPRPVFPSWSWTGWAGSLNNEMLPVMDEHSFQPLVNWFLMNGKREVTALQTEPFMRSYDRGEPPAYFASSPKINRPIPEVFSHTLISNHSKLDKETFWRYPPYLLGWTVSSRFKLRKLEHATPTSTWPKGAGPSTFQVLNKQGRGVGRVSLDCDTRVDENEGLEFIMLSRLYWTGQSASLGVYHLEDCEKLTGKKGPWSLVNVMLVERMGEFCERRGVGSMDEVEWEASGPAEDFIVLR